MEIINIETKPIPYKAIRFDGSPEMVKEIGQLLVENGRFSKVSYNEVSKEREFNYFDMETYSGYGEGTWLVIENLGEKEELEIEIVDSDEQFNKNYQIVK